jgi:hypothetical protein
VQTRAGEPAEIGGGVHPRPATRSRSSRGLRLTATTEVESSDPIGHHDVLAADDHDSNHLAHYDDPSDRDGTTCN